ncbi:MAG TPA: type II secretion system protein GspM [Bryobacteraceae bacterium]|nr:type II secretion system protein GspM [Bryobacteraceae bacterium]
MSLQVGTLDKKYAAMLVVALILFAIFKLGSSGDRTTAVVGATDTIPLAEKRLEKLRQMKATVPAKEEILTQAEKELAARESGLLKGDTKEQAEAQLVELVQSVAKANGIETRGVERYTDAVINSDYGEVSVEVAFNCGIEQLVNLLAALADQPQILATNDVRVTGGTDKKKIIQVRLGVSGIVPRKLLPQKKATS